MPSSRYLELQSRFNSKQYELVDLLSSGRTEQGDYAVSPEEAQRREKEVNDLGAQLRSLRELEEMEERHSRESQERRQVVKGHTHVGGNGGPQGISQKSLGEQVGEALAKQRGSGRKALDQEFTLNVKDWLAPELKASFITSAGWLPESRRTGQVVPEIAAPIEIFQIFPIRQTDTPQPVYMEETTLTNAAAEIAETGPYQESALAMTPRTVNVRKIGTHIPTSDEQFADVAKRKPTLTGGCVISVGGGWNHNSWSGMAGRHLIGILNVAGCRPSRWARMTA